MLRNTHPEALAVETQVRALSKEETLTIHGRVVAHGSWGYTVDGEGALTADEVGAMLAGLPVTTPAGQAWLVEIVCSDGPRAGETVELGVRAFGISAAEQAAREALGYHPRRWDGIREINVRDAAGRIAVMPLSAIFRGF